MNFNNTEIVFSISEFETAWAHCKNVNRKTPFIRR
jgi:hypothetical protein